MEKITIKDNLTIERKTLETLKEKNHQDFLTGAINF